MSRIKFFYSKFYRGQQRAMVVLGFILTLVVLFFFTSRQSSNSSTGIYIEDSTLMARVSEFENNLIKEHEYDSIQEVRYKKTKIHNNIQSSEYKKPTRQEKTENFVFDPNTLDSLGFIKLGFKPHIARSIIRYRKKGGKFYRAEDLKKIYYIDTLKVDELIPFIEIRAIEPSNIIKKIDNYTININTADTSLLVKLPHIGRHRARQIERYRYKLGGFYCIEQLLEACENMSSEDLQDIQNHITINHNDIKKININRASVERLKAHPYINFYQAKAIYELRWGKGGIIEDIDELKNINEFTSEGITKITPYLSTR